jgi:hypothetical protein
MKDVVQPASFDEALQILHDGLAYLATVDPTTMSAETRAECLRLLQQVSNVIAAKRASLLAELAARQAG